jgi:putative ATP-dependent endonuclease of OLD family
MPSRKHTAKDGIRVIEVRIRNFRSLLAVDVKLDRITMLIGANNSGKTSFLEAMSAAMSIGRRVITEDDVYLDSKELKAPKDRVITIDILIRPTDREGNVLDNFPQGSYWTTLWGLAISQDENDNDFLGLRTQYKWSDEQGEYVLERRFLEDWPVDPVNWNGAKIKERGFLTAAQLEPMALYYMDAKRDIEDDLRRTGSFWRRLTSDLGLPEREIKAFEEALNKLNRKIVNKSDVLKHLKSNLDELYDIVSSNKSGIDVTPVARHLRDLGKAIDINFSTKGAQSFPLVRHGMGTRSLASLLVFRAYMTWRASRLKADAIHPMLALEEPEAHLHPQAQRALFAHIERIPGQLIISTHSPYVAGHSRIGDLRHFRKNDSRSHITQVDLGGLGDEDIRAIERRVLNTRGDILFARALLLFEGETEEQVLPIFAEKYWNANIHQLGIACVGVTGSGNYLPFLRLSTSFDVRWYILSDGETEAIKAVDAALTGIKTTRAKCPNVVTLPNGENFEKYIISSGYATEVEAMLAKVEGPTFVNDFIAKMHGQKVKKGTRDYKSAGGRNRALTDILIHGKTKYCKPLAQKIVSIPDQKRRFPLAIRTLLEQISKDHGLKVRRK